MSDGPAVGAHRIAAILARYPRGDAGNLVNVLHDLQAELHYLPERALRQAANYLSLPRAQVFGVATFRGLPPRGRRGHAPRSTSSGSPARARTPGSWSGFERDTGLVAHATPDLSLTVEEVNCLGACALGPLVVVDGEYHGHMTADHLSRLVGKLLEKEEQA